MRTLSKSKILAYRQCPRRLWLEVHRPELRDDSAATKASFTVGNTVGAIAQRLYDPKGEGYVIDVDREGGFEAAFEKTRALLGQGRPIFEAGFSAEGGMAFADVLLPVASGWRMVEVKSAGSVKGYHRDDLAVQVHVARAAGVNLTGAAVAHIDTKWVYPGGDDYGGLFAEKDLTEEATSRAPEAARWIQEAGHLADQSEAPATRTGGHCGTPFDCGFLQHCRSLEPQAEHPVRWLPRIGSKALKAFLAQPEIIDISQVPDELLNEKQLRVKGHTLAGTEFFDEPGAAQALVGERLPAYFLDFETTQFAVPLWAGTRPYEQMPFQFSVHTVSTGESVTHVAFLDLEGTDPRRRLAESLINAMGDVGTIYAYNMGFETTRISELAVACPDLSTPLRDLLSRFADLMPVAASYYYHPHQQGSWSLKEVLPCLFPELDYSSLEGVADGGAASAAYQEAIAPSTTLERKAEIERQLLEYCRIDTFGLVKLWARFSGRNAGPK